MASVDDADSAAPDPTEHEPTGLRRWVPEDPRRFGEEPDYRFTLANERTFLAWIRTALALSAGGLAAVSVLDDEFANADVLGVALLAVAFLTAAGAYRRWANAERSMRLGIPLPASWLPQAMALCTAGVAVIAAILFVIDRA